MKLLNRSAEHERFVKYMTPKIEVSPFLARTKSAEYEIKNNIASVMFEVADFARIIGLNPHIANISQVKVQSEIEDNIAGEYMCGTISLADNSYPMLDRTVAHEMFHNMQDSVRNLIYVSRVQKSYAEGGAFLFESAYRSFYDPIRRSMRVAPSEILLPMSFSEKEVDAIYSGIMRLGCAARGLELYSLLNRTTSSGHETTVHLNGADFVAIATRMIYGNVPKLLHVMLNSSPERAISFLESASESVQRRSVLSRLLR